MSRFSQVSVLLCFSALLTAQSVHPKTSTSTGAGSAIAAVLQSQVEAWNRGDLKGFMEGYWNSPDLVFASGARETHGWEPVLERYKARYQSGTNDMGKLSFSYVDGVHIMSPDFAFVDGQYHLTMSTGKESNGVFTLIFRKFPGGWRIVHDRTCPD